MISVIFVVFFAQYRTTAAVLTPELTTQAPVLEIGQECRSTLTILPVTAPGAPGSEFLPICDPLARLECISGRCHCKKGFTLSHNGSKCLEVARNGLESQCEEDVQCWKGLLGRLSGCDASVGGKCRCYESESVPIVFHQGRCYYGEALGDYCQIDGLCSATTAHALCSPVAPHRGGICQCVPAYVASWDKSRCLPIATAGLNSSCEENIQCEKSGLGTLSECNQERMQCQCYHIPQMGDGHAHGISTIYYAGRCYLAASQLGDACQVNAQCEARIKDAVCGADGKCRCKEAGGGGEGVKSFVAAPNNTACILREAVAVNETLKATPNDETRFSKDNQLLQTVGVVVAAPPAIFTMMPTPTQTTTRECLEDAHCTRVYGSFGRCNVTRGKCECYVVNEVTATNNATATTTTSTEVIKCLPGKRLGEPCKYHRQCGAMNPASHCSSGLCECIEPTHVLSQDGRKCLPVSVAGFGAFCDEDAQCIKSSLGPLSICNEKSNACECTSLLPMSLYNNTCYFQRWVGSFCVAHVECAASLGPSAQCTDGKCVAGRETAVEGRRSDTLQDLYSTSRGSVSSSSGLVSSTTSTSTAFMVALCLCMCGYFLIEGAN